MARSNGSQLPNTGMPLDFEVGKGYILESEKKGGSRGADKALVVGQSEMNLTESKQHTCLAERHEKLEMRCLNLVCAPL